MASQRVENAIKFIASLAVGLVVGMSCAFAASEVPPTEQMDPRLKVQYLEKQAAIAAGCDYLIRLCPARVVAIGREAQAKGYSGASSPVFWVAFVAKLAGIGALLGGGGCVAFWFWIRIGRPEAIDVARAKLLIACSETQIKTAETKSQLAVVAEGRSRQVEMEAETKWRQAEMQAEARIRQAEAAELVHRRRLEEMRMQLDASKQELVAMQKKLDNFRATMTAMRAFRPNDAHHFPAKRAG